jgi:hypothetical protein
MDCQENRRGEDGRPPACLQTVGGDGRLGETVIEGRNATAEGQRGLAFAVE